MPYLHRVMNHGIAMLHPKEELGRLADREKVEYVLGKEKEEEGGTSVRLTCAVLVGKREVGRVGDGLSKMEVQTRAADLACTVLRKEGKRACAEGAEGGDGGDGGVVGTVEVEEVEEEAAEDEEEGGLGQEGMDLDEVLAGSGAGNYDSDDYMTADE